MADKSDVRQRNVLQVRPKVKLTKKQQKEEKKAKKELELRQTAEERAEKLRFEIEAREEAKKVSIEKKRFEAERLERLEAERRRLTAEDRQKREVEELKRRLEKIAISEPRQAIKSSKKSVTDQLRDSLLNILERKDVVGAIGTEALPGLSKFITQSSEFDFKRTLLHEGYSITTKVKHARVLFDIKNSAGLEGLSGLNGEHKFLWGLASFLFGINIQQDARFRIQFEASGYTIALCLHCLECEKIVDGPPQSIDEFCLSLKRFFIANRIAWRDWDLCDLIAEVEKEPGRSDRSKDALRRVRNQASTQARAKHPCFDRRLSRMINDTATNTWLPIVRDSTQSHVDHLSARKKVLRKFPPSFDDCMCDKCGNIGFRKHLVADLFDTSKLDALAAEQKISKSEIRVLASNDAFGTVMAKNGVVVKPFP